VQDVEALDFGFGGRPLAAERGIDCRVNPILEGLSAGLF
jgi:hypothetical protein